MQEHGLRLVIPVVPRRYRPGRKPHGLLPQDPISLPPRGFFDSAMRVRIQRRRWDTPYHEVHADLTGQLGCRQRVFG